MRFHILRERPDRRFDTDVGHGRIPLPDSLQTAVRTSDRFLDQAVGHVHAVRRGHHRLIHEQVAGRKTDGPADLVAVNDFAVERIRPPQIGIARLNVPCFDAFADQGRADDLAAHHHRFEHMHRRAVPCAFLFQQTDIPARLVAECIVESAEDLLRAERPEQELLDVAHRFHPADVPGERDIEQNIDPHRLDDALLFIRIQDVLDDILPRQQIARVVGERKDSAFEALLFSCSDSPAHQFLMAFVHAVEVAQRDRSWFLYVDVFQVVIDLHTFYLLLCSHSSLISGASTLCGLMELPSAVYTAMPRNRPSPNTRT